MQQAAVSTCTESVTGVRQCLSDRTVSCFIYDQWHTHFYV